MTEASPVPPRAGARADNWRLRRMRLTTGASWINQGTNIGSKILVIPLSLGILGQQRFGAWLTLLAFVAWFAMADWGMTSALINPIARSIAGRRHEETRSLVSTGFYFLTAAGAGLAVPCAALVWFLPTEHLLGLHQSGLDVDLRVAVTIVLVLNVGLYNLQITTVVASAMQRGYLAALGDVGGRFVTVVTLVWLYMAHVNSLTAFALAVTVPVAVQRLLLCAVLYRLDTALLPRPRSASREQMRPIIGDSSAFFVAGIGELLYTQAPNIVIAQVLGAASVAVYAVTYQIFFNAFLLLSMLSLPLWPAIADAYQSGEFRWIRRSFRAIMRNSLILAGVGFTLLAIVAPPFIRRWLGPSFQTPFPLLVIFAVLCFAWTFNTVCMAAVTGLGYIRERAAMVTALGAIGLVLTIPGAQRWGLVGVAAAQLLAMLVTQTWYLPYLLNRRAPWLFGGVAA